MNEEVKKLIESCFIFQNKSKTDFLAKNEDMIRKSDFDRVVEELTKWTKVEDGLPETDRIFTPVFVKISGKYLQCPLGYGVALFNSRTKRFTIKERHVIVTEWKYIN